MKFLPFPPPEQHSTVRKKAKGIKKKINDSFLIVEMLEFYDYKRCLTFKWLGIKDKLSDLIMSIYSYGISHDKYD